ncbi:MAG: response regulator [Spirochaetaceae bacterium]|nr:MAG: response regulator [Spirochaetaceae bacterium]
MNEQEIRVLVADDELGIREGCRRILMEEGFEVATASDGIEALEIFDGGAKYSVALVDLMMPRLGGLELIKKLRALDPDLLLIIITAHATIDTAVEGTKQGAYSYIPKPFTPDELLLTIRNGLERQALALEAKRLREERERRLLEVASERSKSGTILKCITDGLLVINLEKLVVLRNNAAARILPKASRQSVPFSLSALEDPKIEALIYEVFQGDPGPRIVSQELEIGKSTFMVNVSPVIEPGGETSGAVAVFRDITELKKLETAKSMFVSMVAHELKSPLAATEGWLNLLLSGLIKDNPKEARHVIERSHLRVKTLRTLVSELLSITAIETGNFQLRRSSVDMAAVAHQAVDAAREKAAAKGISVTFTDCPLETGCTALADGEALGLVFTNLIDNAIKYTPNGGAVTVWIAQNGMYVSVSVEDNGVGIEAEELDKIFEEFYRVKNEYTTDIVGTGLGLSLVKRLVELHQGRIEVESTPGAGSIFTVKVPLS